ncbi:MAG TPA: amidohydrolase family protein [Acidimicrobiales bacterium]|nr:amidohydrolase family protein [Acidimicrobiales bacterium]
MGAEGEYDLNWITSVDDHIVEPPNVWQDRVPSKYKDVAPRVIIDDKGVEVWAYEDIRGATGGLGASAGRRPEDITALGFPYTEMRPGCYDAKARLLDMNDAGILASLNFPSFPRFCGQVFWEAKDKELALLCVKAYNDWMIDEWCGTDPSRLIPLAIIPLWDTQLAVAELERVHAKGCNSFCFSENFEPLGLPTIHTGHWDPVLRAANDMHMVLSIHIGSSSTFHKISKDSPFMANFSLGMIRPMGCLMDWIFSGLFQRFPNIKIALSEGSIGWIPWVLERAQQVYTTQRHWVAKGVSLGNVGPVQDYDIHIDTEKIDVYRDYREHFYGCFIDDATGLGMLDVIGEDNVMIETDYPHSDTSWPHSIKLAHERLDAAGLSPAVQYKILRGNAERLYQFKAADPPDLVRP